jgi:hypothetical protein
MLFKIISNIYYNMTIINQQCITEVFIKKHNKTKQNVKRQIKIFMLYKKQKFSSSPKQIKRTSQNHFLANQKKIFIQTNR